MPHLYFTVLGLHSSICKTTPLRFRIYKQRFRFNRQDDISFNENYLNNIYKFRLLMRMVQLFRSHCHCFWARLTQLLEQFFSSKKLNNRQLQNLNCIQSNKHFYKFAGPQKPPKLIINTQMSNQNHLSHTGLKNTSIDAIGPLHFQTRQPPKPALEHAKDHNIISESTNNTISPTQNATYLEQFNNEDNSQNAVGFHLAQKYSQNSHFQQQDNSNTKIISKVSQKKPDKMKMAMDEAPTNKISNNFYAAIKKQIKKEAAPHITEKKLSQKKNVNYVQVKEDQVVTSKLPIPYNQAAEKIMQGKSLRERFTNLLRDEQKYAIGHQHRKLLRILKNIDTTIEFATMSKNIRSYFLYDLKMNLRDNLRMDISRKQISQLLFIDSQLFKVQWAMNYSCKKYDILITLPTIKSQDQRQAKTRKALVEYLFAKQVEFLAQKQQEKSVIDCWSPGFDPNNYEIPSKQLPIHPEVKDIEIRAMQRENIDKIQNNHLRQYFNKKKDESQAKSMCSKDVQKMIFSKKTNAEIEQRLLAAVRQRQAKIAIIDISKVPIDNSMLKMVCEEIMIQYMGRNVSNIPKATLVDSLNKKFSGFKIQSIILCVKHILQAAQIGFIKEVVTASKTVICQINKEKFKNMLNYLENKKFD